MGGRSKTKRLFLAIELPRGIQDELSYFQDRWHTFPARWTPREQLHITLAFLGDVLVSRMDKLSVAISAVTRKHQSFELTLTATGFETDILKDGRAPRMVWARIGESKPLETLYQDVRKTLAALPFRTHTQRSTLTAHVTLGRFGRAHMHRWEGEEPPPLEEKLNLTFEVEEVALMESVRNRGGTEYFVLQSFMLSE